MSDFRGTYEFPGLIELQAVEPDPSKSTTPNVVKEGHLWLSKAQKAPQLFLNSQQQGLVLAPAANVTPVTATNPSAAANLMAYGALPAKAMNVVGKNLYLWGAGTYTTAGGQTPTFNLTVVETNSGVTLLTWTSTATTAGVTKGWNFEAFLTVQASGATGALESHGIFDVELGAGAAGSVAETSFNDANSAVSASVDLTAALTFQVKCLFSSSNAGNSIVQRQLVVEVLN